MTIQELLGPEVIADLKDHQLRELVEAHEQNPDAVSKIWRNAQTANNPIAVLISSVRKLSTEVDVVVEAYDLDGVVNDALRLYNTRTNKYPPTDQPGWTEADAIIYAVDTAQLKHSRFHSNEIERALRIRIGRPWTADQDPDLHKPGGSPPELLENILNKVGRIGAMPDNKSEAQLLAERLRLKGQSNAVDPKVYNPKPKPKVDTADLARRLLESINKGEAA
jgi:hypothetical protein